MSAWNCVCRIIVIFAVKFTKSKAKVTLMWGFLFRAIERILCLESALFVTGMLNRPQLLRLKSLRRKCAFWRRRNTVSEKRKILLSVESVGQSHSGQLPRREWLLSSWSLHTSKFIKWNKFQKWKLLCFKLKLEEAKVKVHALHCIASKSTLRKKTNCEKQNKLRAC